MPRAHATYLLDMILLPMVTTAGSSFTPQDVSTTTEHSNITSLMINGGVIAGISTAIVIAILLTIIVIVIFITRRRAKNNTSIHLADNHHNDNDEMRIESTSVPMNTIFTAHIPANVNEAYGITIPRDTNQDYGIVNTEDHVYAFPNEEENRPPEYDYIY